MTKREALKRLRRETQMLVAYQERQDEAMVVAREAGATMSEIGAVCQLTTGGVSHRLAGLDPMGRGIPRGATA